MIGIVEVSTQGFRPGWSHCNHLQRFPFSCAVAGNGTLGLSHSLQFLSRLLLLE
jgi:hypothetical protein